MSGYKLFDSYNRQLNYLRVSITDRCNLNCRYCEPRKNIPFLSHEEILRYEEILRLVQIFVNLGVNKVRVTGGEPLVRKGVYSFLDRLALMEGLKDVSLTTNGVLLSKNLNTIKNAGIQRVNISLDTLKPEKFKKITGHDLFDTVWESILKAHAHGFSPIKLNTVVLSGINDDELEDLARLSFSFPFHVRFIEYMPVGRCSIPAGEPLLTPEIMSRLLKLGELSPVKSGPNDGPAARYKFKGAIGEIGFISAMSSHFCHACNRLRLTASGKLRTCLLSDHSVDLKRPMREGRPDKDLARIILESILKKQSEHHLGPGCKERLFDGMSSIGG